MSAFQHLPAGIKAGIIIGSIIGGLLFLLCCAFVIFFVWCLFNFEPCGTGRSQRRRRQNQLKRQEAFRKYAERERRHGRPLVILHWWDIDAENPAPMPVPPQLTQVSRRKEDEAEVGSINTECSGSSVAKTQCGNDSVCSDDTLHPDIIAEPIRCMQDGTSNETAEIDRKTTE